MARLCLNTDGYRKITSPKKRTKAADYVWIHAYKYNIKQRVVIVVPRGIKDSQFISYLDVCLYSSYLPTETIKYCTGDIKFALVSME